MNYRIEKLSKGNLSSLSYLYKFAFKKDITIEYLQKKQNTDKFGDSFVGFIAFDNSNVPAAFYGVYPCLLEYNDKKYLVAQSGDTMTHPDHCRKGLFTQLAKKTYEYCMDNGFHFVFGFPNQNSYPGFVRKLDWIHFDDLQSYQIRVKTISKIRLEKIFFLKEKTYERYTEYILSKYKNGKPFKASNLENNIGSIDHSSDFFEYKTYEKSFLIEILGKSIWLKPSDMFLYIGDIERCSTITFKKIISKLKRLSFFLGIPHIRFNCSTNSWLEKAVKTHSKKMKNNYAVAGINFTKIISFENIKFTMGDNDTF